MVPSARASVTVRHGDAGHLDDLEDGSVHLIVTSPPYPMIPQWDAAFRAQGASDYEEMHDRLGAAWKEAYRVLVEGGLLAIVVGDALRRREGEFRLWPNHAEVLSRTGALGFRPLPYVLWKKPMNRPNAFLGSGFLPPNAYVTLDCEFILLLRKGALRAYPRADPARYRSRFSRAERDRWFTQVWADVRGASQRGETGRTGAFPAEIPARLIRMFSVEGETVLDPFAGTGTTLWEAARLGRRAIGYEWDPRIYAELAAESARRGFTDRGARRSGPTRRSVRANGVRSPRSPGDANTRARQG
ncbi:MAG: DNA-methyltransferase [Thermoplasmata archaeon]